MRILVTGSSGRLGRRLMKSLADRGHAPVGVDIRPARSTDVTASILDRDAIGCVLRDGRFDAVIHSAALHRPQLATHAALFPETNVSGTRTLLDLAEQAGVRRFVYTSTTAVMTDRHLASGAIREARWLTEDTPLTTPSDVYGATKLAAEELCRRRHSASGMKVVVLRPSRFFHRDVLDHSRDFTQANHRANEMLNRRVAVSDVVMAHALAVERADRLTSNLFIISAPTPFVANDCPALLGDARSVVARYFPDFQEIYARRRWKMYPSIDRVYVSRRAQEVLGLDFLRTFEDELNDAQSRPIMP